MKFSHPVCRTEGELSEHPAACRPIPEAGPPWQAGQAPVESMWGQCGQVGGEQGYGAAAPTGTSSPGQTRSPSLGCKLDHGRWGNAENILDGLLGFIPIFTFPLTPTVPKPKATQTTGCGLTWPGSHWPHQAQMRAVLWPPRSPLLPTHRRKHRLGSSCQLGTRSSLYLYIFPTQCSSREGQPTG